MSKKIILILSLCISLFVSGRTNAQESLSYGIDPQRDSAAFARYRAHLDVIRRERPTVALVLSGGGAKGAAHISVIRYLERAGIPIDLILGTSIGGLVGGLYACGYDAESLEAIIRSLDWDNLLYDSHHRKYNSLAQKDYDRQYVLSIPYGTYRWDFHRPETSRRMLLRDGIVLGRNIEDLFASLLVGYGDETDFLSLPIPFACVASDMISAKPKIWHSGSLVQALRSTMSIPGLFTPVKCNNMVLMDGGMRNNYPAEIAKKMGADIIIGVDISSPSLDASQMRSMLDIVIQTNDVLGRESYNAGLAVTDIYIQPDLSDFSLLSFDKQSIDSILLRGQRAVEAAADQINNLKTRLNNPNIHRSHNPFIPKATNLHKNTVKIDKVLFYGINAKEEKYLRKLIHIENGDKRVAHIMELEEYISLIMGTKAFEKVTFQLLGKEEPYTLLFNCFRAPVNQIGASIRLDSRDFTTLLLHYGVNTHQLTGSRLDFAMRLGSDTRISAAYSVSTGHGVDLGTTISFQSVMNGDFKTFDNDDYSIHHNLTRADAHISFLPWRRMSLSLGFQLDYLYITSVLADINRPYDNIEITNKTNLFPSPYFTLRHDSFDEPYFPTQGSLYQVSFNTFLKGLKYYSPITHAAQIHYLSAHSLGRLTFMPVVDARVVTNNILPYINMLAVSDANHTKQHHITFAGINAPYATMRILGVAGLHTRLRVAKKHYLTATAQLLHEANDFKSLIDKDKSDSHIGLSLEYAYNSFIGPLRFNVHWSDITKSMGFYFSIGLDF